MNSADRWARRLSWFIILFAIIYFSAHLLGYLIYGNCT